MTDTNGVNISNREIFDAVQDVSKKLDDHIARHDERDKLATKRIEHTRTWWQTKAMWAAVAISLTFGVIGVLPK